MKQSQLPIITKSRLIKDLKQLGLTPGMAVMLHVSVKAIGWIVGGPDMVIQVLLDLLSPKGTLMMLASWEDSPYDLPGWPEEKQRAYLGECPPFDPHRSRAYRKWSILCEYLRTWSGAYRSNHPDNSFVAVGFLARWITKDHPLQYGYGPGSPLAKLCEANGKVLVLGSPIHDITLLHYAEHMARVPNKRIVHYKMPVLQNGKRTWVEIEEFDTSRGIVDWQGDYFETIVREYLSYGKVCSGKVGAAQSYLLDAGDLTEFGIQWMEKTLGDKEWGGGKESQ